MGALLILMMLGQTHEPIGLLDADGVNVAESGRPVSPMKTCAQDCHDTDYIASHSFHAEFGPRWDPITYLPPQEKEEWIRALGHRHVGGGPALPLVEMNCFICHLKEADDGARRREISEGRFEWAATATLAGTGLVRRTDDGWAWEGVVEKQDLPICDPCDTGCGVCHGVVHVGSDPLLPRYGNAVWEIETKGRIFASQRISASGMNLAGKGDLSLPWDVHAERLVRCVKCHYSENNPDTYRETGGGKPRHLKFDPRRLDHREYHLRPSHFIARGRSDKGDGAMRRCEDCHDAVETHRWFPYRQRHFEKIACEACHVPRIHAPARRVTDYTVLVAPGEPRIEYRGVEGPPEEPGSLVTGYEPVLLPRDGLLFPFNVVTTWYWVAGDPPTPVPLEALEKIYFQTDDPPPEVLETPEKVETVRRSLEAAGFPDARIVGEIQPFGLHHNVVTGEWATRDCDACHLPESRMSAPIVLAMRAPHGTDPHLVGSTNVSMDGHLRRTPEGGWIYEPTSESVGIYVLGHDSFPLGDIAGLIAVIFVVVGVALHGAARAAIARRGGA